MTVTFYSNFLNHHQLPFCEAMAERLGGGFTFVATEPFDAGVVSKGFADMNTAHPFSLPSYAGAAQGEKARRLALESDVIIHGSAPEEFMTRRLKKSKGLSFRYSERLFRPMNPKTMYWRAQKDRFMQHTLPSAVQNKRLYLLCAGAYTLQDYHSFGAYKKKAYKWGYFPQGSPKTENELMRKKGKTPPLLVWAGRMIPLKHGEDAIHLAKTLKDAGLDFSLRMIGDGPCRVEWERMAAERGVADCVTFTGALPVGDVIGEMEQAHIVLFTSDANEGWGAVLNEGMSAGCAVLANRAIGAAPYLLRHGENGLLYDDRERFLHLGLQLAQDPAQVAAYGRAAKKTIDNTWNERCAAASFITLCQYLQENKTGSPIADGPGSPA